MMLFIFICMNYKAFFSELNGKTLANIAAFKKPTTLISLVLITTTFLLLGFSNKGFGSQNACANNPNDANCNGQDPINQGCNADAYTVSNGTVNIKDSQNTVIGYIELRYSNKCKSNWTRVTSLIGSKTLWARIERDDGLNYTFQINNTNTLYTDMVFAPVRKALAQGAFLINNHYIAANTPFL